MLSEEFFNKTIHTPLHAIGQMTFIGVWILVSDTKVRTTHHYMASMTSGNAWQC